MTQLTLFDDVAEAPADLKLSRSGTFVDNMSLPIHRWFRYSAGFAAPWVEKVLADWGIKPGHVVLDPFVGSGTVPVVCDTLRVNSIGVEAHPVVARICKAKLLWTCDPERVGRFATEVLKHAQDRKSAVSSYPQLIHRSFAIDALESLDNLKLSWFSLQDSSPESEHMACLDFDPSSDIKSGYCSMAIYPAKQDKEEGDSSAICLSAAGRDHQIRPSMDASKGKAVTRRDYRGGRPHFCGFYAA